MMRKHHSKSDGRSKRQPEQAAMEMVRFGDRQGRVFKRTLVTSSTIATGVGGFLGVLNAASSGSVIVSANWANFQGIAQEYRVLAVAIECFPLVNAQTVPTTPTPSMIAICAYSSDASPGSYNVIAQGPGAKIVSGLKPFKFAVSAKGYPQAMLWTATASTITTAYLYGITMSDPGTVPASTASTVYFRATVRYFVEFRSLD